MFGRTRARLSLQFSPSAITTRRFEKAILVSVFADISGRMTGEYIPVRSRVWAEARPAGKGLYRVTEKELQTHSHFDLDGSSKLYKENSIRASFGGRSETRFTREEAVTVLKDLEAEFRGEFYRQSPKQPCKKRLYTHREIIAAQRARRKASALKT